MPPEKRRRRSGRGPGSILQPAGCDIGSQASRCGIERVELLVSPRRWTPRVDRTAQLLRGRRHHLAGGPSPHVPPPGWRSPKNDSHSTASRDVPRDGGERSIRRPRIRSRRADGDTCCTPSCSRAAACCSGPAVSADPAQDDISAVQLFTQPSSRARFSGLRPPYASPARGTIGR